MYFIVLVGPAGSGKTTLAGELAAYIESYGPSVARLNFDPAAETLSYDADVDVRSYVTAQEFMAKGLGPNGALIAAVDSLINHVFDIRRALEEIKPDYVIVDTPGQMELFAYRHGGPIVLNALTHGYPSVTVFLMDAIFFENPASIVSVLTLASSVAVRLQRPQINIVSKADLLMQDVLENVVTRLGEEGFLESLATSSESDLYTRALMLSLASALESAGFIGEVIPVSVNSRESMDALYAKIQQLLKGGEEEKYYDQRYEKD
ncbi:MAG: ATP/GTP-binding protein [Acidilobaceae archaeon]|nr:ATP/GTP-binding protein [Acidilobaceae archaeon]MCX8165721.1 ATP/GTP-binding protein [Acidilobaceae archaeon]MDW7974146.1 ATP/GTP-binding protein [Sulfolobales archaeon]